MNRKWCVLPWLAIALLLTGCTVEKLEAGKQRDIEFTVVKEEEIPQELKSQMEEGAETPLKLSYGDKGYLYITCGYGRQATSGYSVEVTELYETENAVYIHTNLIGPSKEEEIVEKATYPYVVVKMEYNEKHVVFE